MGGTSGQQQQQQAQTISQPWAPTQGALTGVLGQINSQLPNTGPTATETGAFGQLASNAAAGNPYAGQIGNVANTLLSGGPDLTGGANKAYDQYSSQIMPWANGSMGDPSTNPALAQMLSTIRSDVSNQVNGQFAAAGRDNSGLNQQALARGISQGEAPALLNAQQMGLGAAQNLYNAGNSTTGILSGLSQNTLANQQAGVGQAGNALAALNYGPEQQLAVAGAQRQLPLSNIANINSLLLPIAGLGGQTSSTGSSSGTQTMSGAQQAWGWLGALSKFMPKGGGTPGAPS